MGRGISDRQMQRDIEARDAYLLEKWLEDREPSGGDDEQFDDLPDYGDEVD